MRAIVTEDNCPSWKPSGAERVAVTDMSSAVVSVVTVIVVTGVAPPMMKASSDTEWSTPFSAVPLNVSGTVTGSVPLYPVVISVRVKTPSVLTGCTAKLTVGISTVLSGSHDTMKTVIAAIIANNTFFIIPYNLVVLIKFYLPDCKSGRAGAGINDSGPVQGLQIPAIPIYSNNRHIRRNQLPAISALYSS